MNNLPEKKQSNLIKIGDVFQLGEHRLACGDCRNTALLKRLIGSDRVASINCDPPYGVAYTQSKAGFSQVRKAKNIANDEEVSEETYTKFTKEWLNAIKIFLTPKNSIYIFNCDKMLFALREGMLQAGFKFSQLLIWVKNHSVIGRKDYLPQHELIIYGWHGTHDFKKAKDKSVLLFPKPNRSSLHPTMKPVGIIRHLILNSTKVGDTVFDGFCGSGTCLIACEQTKRKCLAMEQDVEYCQTIIDRWQQLTGKEAIKLPQKKEVVPNE